MTTSRKIGIMGAMPEEIDGIVQLLTGRAEATTGMRTYYTGTINGIEAVVVFSRWGKVAAAATVSTLIHRYQVTDLIFMGVAGAISPDLSIGDIVLASRLVQHDMDARPIMPQYEIPLLGKSFFEADAHRSKLAADAIHQLLEEKALHQLFSQATLHAFGITRPRLFTGDIASGDQFFSDTTRKLALHQSLPGILCVEMEGAAVAQVCYEYSLPFVLIRTISDVADDQAHIDFPLFIRQISSRYAAHIIHTIFRHLKA
jgi:adenosylhomocysteine nucleosidase